MTSFTAKYLNTLYPLFPKKWFGIQTVVAFTVANNIFKDVTSYQFKHNLIFFNFWCPTVSQISIHLKLSAHGSKYFERCEFLALK